ncbi:stage II sporulation protein R [Hathewaya proteolytica DSM 3090]|uniref:Stage II sporulation protein R n=1 Tax=Hathewaya proteolytica DSM 3090 TaxID=1121331 RepID=A0A1M6S7K8_9CLOT|nr:stage II sporulation protein R [Hathewaya proteolytica]SHK40762.1 stage II sporulation protein R [Hathewaya proteolytica DSM 3090]
MKRILWFVVLCVIICSYAYTSKIYAKRAEETMLGDISNKIIRFHVLANSDCKEDQELKLKVRDEVLKYISPKIKDCNSIVESRKIINKYNDEIMGICRKVIKKNGYKYNVSSELSRENFPSKTYGNITLPQGEYESYRILIGEAQGHNWWCLMFPPLCFADVTKVEVNELKVESEMKSVLTEEQYDFINNKGKKPDFTLKSKIFECIKEFLK